MYVVRNVFIGIFLKTEACEWGCVIHRVILHQSECGTLYSCFSLKSQDIMKEGRLSWMWQWILQFQKRTGISWPDEWLLLREDCSIDINMQYMTQEREREGGGGSSSSNSNTYVLTRKQELRSCMVDW